ncbi:fibronectin type III domain-containing protein [Actinoplanes sp. NBRC 103695]|uniref:fibronectin type III domain-containing protein n=1 Tax=Actinoplanes sp. NBRC 103695 TaxID=3032202 RepID=UPI0024A0DBED|nr:fibronectin type III domain-containing protein [Actinoplanes sp. NBRC 103695]GLY98609.1 hypothetical protein Acsp02_58630 [Actinoplanes sp. NBRC 103695]
MVVLALLVAATAVVSSPAPARAALTPAAGQYMPVTPARIINAKTLAVGATHTFSPLGQGGIPASGVSAVAFQLTAKGSSTDTGYLEVIPAGVTRPNASHLNYAGTTLTTNSVVTPLGTGNQVSIYSGSASADVIFSVDVVGYFRAAGGTTAGSTYVPLTPARILPTTPITAGGNVLVSPLGAGGIPTTGVSAVVAHVTLTGSATAGQATVYPDGTTRPGTVDLSYGTTPPYTNQVHATLGANGKFRVYSTNAANMLVDVVGYYQKPTGTAAGSSYVGVTPARVLNGEILGAQTTASYVLAGAGGIPATGATAAAFNLTATGQGAAGTDGALSAFAADATRPVVRQLSYRAGGAWPSLQVSKLSADGRISIYNSGTAPVRLLLDVAGYYKPASVPGAPLSVQANAEAGKANVSWTRPVSDGGAAITGYRITATPGGAGIDVVDTTSAVFAGLTNGTAYTFTVTARNAVGPGPVSAASAAVTPLPATVPGAPTGVTAEARNTGVRVRWVRPADDGRVPLDSYTVTASPGGATVTVTAPTTAAEIPGLTNGTAYTFTVRATNAIGTGAASAATAAIAPRVTVPDAPGNVAAVAAGNGTVTVEWSAPGYTGGNPITGYSLLVQPGGRTVTAAATARSIDVTGLTSNTAYTFAVKAAGVSGAGAAATTTPVQPDLAMTAQARLLSNAAAATLTTVGTSSLTFVNAPAEITGLTAGNILIVPEVTAAPDGLLRKVGQVTTSGTSTTVTTTNAELADAFTDGGYSLLGNMWATNPDSLSANEFNGTIEVPVIDWKPATGVTVNGTVSLELTVDGKLDIGDRSAEINMEATSKAELSAKSETEVKLLEGERPLGRKKGKFSKIGRLRPYVEAQYFVYIKGSVTRGVTTSASVSKTVRTHLDIDDPTLSTATHDPLKSEVKEPSSYTKVSLELGVKQKSSIGLLGKSLADIEYRLSANGLYDPDGDPWWKVEGCAAVGVDVLPFFGRSAFKNDNLLHTCEPIAQAKGPLAQIAVTPAIVPMARSTTQAFTATSRYVGGTPVWSVEGTDNGTITSAGVYTAPAKDGQFVIKVTIPASIGRPAQAGQAEVHVGVPGAPTVSVWPVPREVDGNTRVGINVADGTPPGWSYWAYINPVEPGSVCQPRWLLGTGNWWPVDRREVAPFPTCGLMVAGRTYTFRVVGFNAYGEGFSTTSNPVTISGATESPNVASAGIPKVYVAK